MRLIVTTPTAVIAEVGDVVHLRAEDETGAFGILAGHADFLTVLTTSVVTWRATDGREHQVAVRGGVLSVQQGSRIDIAASEAVRETGLGTLGESVLERFRVVAEGEAAARVSTARMHLAAIRQIQRVLSATRGPLGLEERAAPGSVGDDGLGAE